MPLQGRVGDNAHCPADSHGCTGCAHGVRGPGVAGSPDVTVNKKAALRVDDPGVHSTCCGPNTWRASQGSATVTINSKPAHRLGDATAHCGGNGTLVQGSPDVDVGDAGASGASGGKGKGKGKGAQAAPAGTESVPLGSRPVYSQEEGMSCGIGAARMAIATMTGKNIPESALREQSSGHGPGGYSATTGTAIWSVERLLRDNGVGVQGIRWFGSVSDIQSNVGPARPAVALLNNPGHYVVVDEVQGTTAGQRTLVVRDPWYGQQTMSEADFNKRFSGHFIRLSP
ncbi:MAG TPA: PAAR domain-containing protein [Candidatus Nanopelagicales bacterium]|nr:PAAR domain-containing protein [Candidatus Nanopelagicales bacterium]